MLKKCEFVQAKCVLISISNISFTRYNNNLEYKSCILFLTLNILYVSAICFSHQTRLIY